MLTCMEIGRKIDRCGRPAESPAVRCPFRQAYGWMRAPVWPLCLVSCNASADVAKGGRDKQISETTLAWHPAPAPPYPLQTWSTSLIIYSSACRLRLNKPSSPPNAWSG
eukprot:859917-Amphidinium_carterae.1